MNGAGDFFVKFGNDLCMKFNPLSAERLNIFTFKHIIDFFLSPGASGHLSESVKAAFAAAGLFERTVFMQTHVIVNKCRQRLDLLAVHCCNIIAPL